MTYDKGGWAFWMLLEHMGRERNLEGIREFIATYRDGPDYPLIEDFLAVLRKHAADPDVRVLQLRRKLAELTLPKATVAAMP